MPRYVPIKNPFAKKTRDLAQTNKGYDIQNDIVLLVQKLQAIEKDAFKLANASGKAKRIGRDVHTMIVRAKKEKNNAKKTAYAKKINDTIKQKLDPILEQSIRPMFSDPVMQNDLKLREVEAETDLDWNTTTN